MIERNTLKVGLAIPRHDKVPLEQINNSLWRQIMEEVQDFSTVCDISKTAFIFKSEHSYDKITNTDVHELFAKYIPVVNETIVVETTIDNKLLVNRIKMPFWKRLKYLFTNNFTGGKLK